MSDAAQGPGWWVASDGKWYPPEARPGAVPPPPPMRPPQPSQKKGGGGRALAKGCLVSLAVIGGLIVVGVIIAVLGSGDSDQPDKAANASCAGVTYPDQQPDDQCAALGAPVENFGQTVVAANVRRQPGLLGKSELCADVSYVNRSDDTKDFNQFHWKLQTPSGVVKSFELTNSTLGSGQLVTGGTKTGSVCFEDSGEKGQHILIWKPEAFRSDRGIWAVNL